MFNVNWPTAVADEADNVSSVSASACHIGGLIYVNPGELALVYGTVFISLFSKRIFQIVANQFDICFRVADDHLWQNVFVAVSRVFSSSPRPACSLHKIGPSIRPRYTYTPLNSRRCDMSTFYASLTYATQCSLRSHDVSKVLQGVRALFWFALPLEIMD